MTSGRFCRYHCKRCCSHFTSLRAFDAHHQGHGGDHVPCVFPDDAELAEKTGVCEIAGPRREGVTIYEHGPSAERGRNVRERLGPHGKSAPERSQGSS